MKAIILTLEENSLMNAKLPKVLNELLDKKMINYCIDTLKQTKLFSEIFVYESAKADIIKKALGDNICYINSSQLSSISGEDNILIINGDSPLVLPETIISFYNKHISEENEITKSPSFAFIKGGLVAEAVKNGACTEPDNNSDEFMSVNTKIALYKATEILKKRINEKHMNNGVTIINPMQAYISPDVKIGCDTVIYPNTYLKGNTVIGEGCIIGPDCSLTNMIVGDLTEILKSTAIDSKLGRNTHVGPYAYIRPNSQIGDNAKIGDFVEVKNAIIGDNSKASHLTYIGDAIVGKNVNFGCGTITSNYDGSNKYKTVVEDNVFIGCNTNLVAPVTINESAYIAAGSTITDDVPEKSLAIARARQVVKLDWKKD